jgi:hypothetical protein
MAYTNAGRVCTSTQHENLTYFATRSFAIARMRSGDSVADEDEDEDADDEDGARTSARDAEGDEEEAATFSEVRRCCCRQASVQYLTLARSTTSPLCLKCHSYDQTRIQTQ